MRSILLLFVTLAPLAWGADVYNSPNDDGIAGGSAGVPINGSPVLLNLYIDGGPIDSAPADKCTGNGDGDELCGWQLRLDASGGMIIEAFTPAGTVVGTSSALTLRANGLDAINPSAGPQPVGTVTVSSQGEGELRLTSGLAVGSTLFAQAIPDAILASTAIDADSDGVTDSADNCTLVQNADQRDTNGDGYGNACDPDLNNDLIVNTIDLGLFRTVFFTADADADFNGDGIVNTLDLGQLKLQFFNPPGPSGLAP